MARKPGYFAIDQKVGNWGSGKAVSGGGTRGPSLKTGPGSRTVKRAQMAAGIKSGRAAARGGSIKTVGGKVSMKGVKATAYSSPQFQAGFRKGQRRDAKGRFA